MKNVPGGNIADEDDDDDYQKKSFIIVEIGHPTITGSTPLSSKPDPTKGPIYC